MVFHLPFSQVCCLAKTLFPHTSAIRLTLYPTPAQIPRTLLLTLTEENRKWVSAPVRISAETPEAVITFRF